MKVLLDECMPRKLKYALPEHECQTAPEAGLANHKNGILLSLAESAGFEPFFTMDKGLEYQQYLAGRGIAILIVRAKSNRLKGSVTASGSVPVSHKFDQTWLWQMIEQLPPLHL